MPKEFLGRGWKFPVGIDSATGRIKTSSYEEDIKESIRIILLTARGERVMHPDFGCGIHDYIYESINTINLGLIELSVKQALNAWEKRIESVEVKALTDSLTGGKLNISIDYKVSLTNNRDNMVFPFYLQEG